ncbi:BTB/POZ domain-containing protein [Panicum miliaceum]|uniref:BTB/POZ domain-containing protein n=1 Tax=Panicum miliaceum TaxID=4540 RepID=A0A3L6QQL4_PANMI|nr:BTB/POZ domain-containing protein [Panicum miliaceum]
MHPRGAEPPNERRPLRIMVPVLFFKQLQLRSSIVAERLMISECLDGGAWRQLGGLLVSGEHHRGAAGWPLAARENQTLREGVVDT